MATESWQQLFSCRYSMVAYKQNGVAKGSCSGGAKRGRESADGNEDEAETGSSSAGASSSAATSGGRAEEADANSAQPLLDALALRSVDVRQPLIAHEEFYNEALSEVIEPDKDFINYKVRPSF